MRIQPTAVHAPLTRGDAAAKLTKADANRRDASAAAPVGKKAARGAATEIGKTPPVTAPRRTVTDTYTPSAPTPANAPRPPLTVNGLLDAWGRSESTFDLNRDKTVNVTDLLALLARGGTGDAPPPPPPGATLVDPDAGAAKLPPPPPDDGGSGGSEPPHAMTIQGLLDAWGLQDSAYDLNADGAVNVTDLLKWLAQDGPNHMPPGATADIAPGATPATAGGPVTDTDPPPMTLEGLLEEWGNAASRYDFNRDGTVNVTDLLKWLAKDGP